ncbi:GNAT family N-acetyltransferase [Streptomyces sp. NPDC029006]|uniref:GNAT family N-acetyltransferase n=1 Tax=Streptomyces sp. NPDC029006 TaxID=3155467 RepID=UPI0034106A82
MTPVLRTERLEFLPYRPEHEDVFVSLLRDEEVCRWMGQELVPEPEIRALFRAILDEVYPHRRFDVWGLWLSGTYVGHAEVKRTGNVDGHELVTALAPGYWGRGLGGEVVRGLLRHAADNLGLTEAYGMVGAGNTASLTMCRRLGFRHVRDVVADDGTVTKLLVIPTTAAPAAPGTDAGTGAHTRTGTGAPATAGVAAGAVTLAVPAGTRTGAPAGAVTPATPTGTTTGVAAGAVVPAAPTGTAPPTAASASVATPALPPTAPAPPVAPAAPAPPLTAPLEPSDAKDPV